MKPRGAEARRNRILKIYAAALLAALTLLAGYCALRPGFDLSTPERTMRSFKRAMDRRRWAQAEACLSAGCRAHYAPFIADRRLFDFYSPYGYETEWGSFLPDWRYRQVEITGEGAARVRIYSGLPLVPAERAGFWMTLVRGPDGRWRVDGPRENCAALYEQLIPEGARGWAAAHEAGR